MSELKLQYDVHTLDNQLLLPAGSILSTETLEKLTSLSRSLSFKTYPLLQYGAVKEDLLRFLKRSPYNVIFSDLEQTIYVLKLMENVNLVLPVLHSLDYFRENDFYTYHHILMVFALSTLLAVDLMPDFEDQIKEAATGPTHDIGKVCVSLSVLKKPGPLTKKELSLLKHHAAAGYILLSYYLKDHNNFSALVARDHHERKDGSGYPSGIELTDRMVEVVAVSDVYDALISRRPYRPVSYDNRTACEEIISMADRGEIGWEATKALVAHNRREKPHFSDCRVSDEKRGKPPEMNFYGVISEDENENPDKKDK